MTKRMLLAQHEIALRIAAEEFYQRKVVMTGIEHRLIGLGRGYASKKEWIELQMEDWLAKAREEMGG